MILLILSFLDFRNLNIEVDSGRKKTNVLL